MKRIIIAPDSFKGTLSAVEVCEIIGTELKKRHSGIEVISVPVADGGEGTAEAFLHALGGEKQFCKVKSPLMREIDAFYALLPDGTAVIEMAQASGITIEKVNNALKSSTYGTGELILHALNNGIRSFIIGIGGSATTDGGTGALSALGVGFLDKKGKDVPFGGEGLTEIDRIDLSGLDKRIKECKITVLCDVKNPLYGENGAAYIFAPQKGADENEVRLLDEGLRNFARASENILGADFSSVEGAGAAGGLGFGLVAFLGAEMKKGIDCVLDVTDFDTKILNADLVITGEGKMDNQSLMGKVPFSVAKRSKGKRVVAVVGVSEISSDEAKRYFIDEIIETNDLHLPFEEIKLCAKQMLIDACKQIII